jgi:hypothetical protein
VAATGKCRLVKTESRADAEGLLEIDRGLWFRQDVHRAAHTWVSVGCSRFVTGGSVGPRVGSMTCFTAHGAFSGSEGRERPTDIPAVLSSRAQSRCLMRAHSMRQLM